MQDILRCVAERDFIVILIGVSGHYVFWTKMQQKVYELISIVVFYDPLNNEVTNTVRSLADIAIQTIVSATEDHTIVLEGQQHVMHIPTQKNGWDCGFYVMKTI